MGYAARTEVFSNWIAPGNGFVCQCPRCKLTRELPELAELEEEVRIASRLSSASSPYVCALSQERRQENAALLESLPVEGRSALLELWSMEAFSLAAAGRLEAGLEVALRIPPLQASLYGNAFLDGLYHTNVVPFALLAGQEDVAAAAVRSAHEALCSKVAARIPISKKDFLELCARPNPLVRSAKEREFVRKFANDVLIGRW